MKKRERDEIRKKIDSIVQRLERDKRFRAQMNAQPEDTLIAAGLGPEAR